MKPLLKTKKDNIDLANFFYPSHTHTQKKNVVPFIEFVPIYLAQSYSFLLEKEGWIHPTFL